MTTTSVRSMAEQTLYVDEVDRLVGINSRGNVIETTMRIRALAELSQLESDDLLALAHVLHQPAGVDRLAAFIAVNR